MGYKKYVYDLFQMLWVAGAAFGLLAIYTGNAEPVVAASQLPGGDAPLPNGYLFGTIALVSLGPPLLVKLLTPDKWSQIQDQTALTLEGDVFSGSIDGRPVRARTERRKVGGDSKSSNHATFTIVEADLEAPITESMLINIKGSENGLEEFGANLGTETTVVNDEFVVLGGESGTLATEILTTRTRDALRATEENSVSIGATAELMTDHLPDMSDSLVGGLFKGKFEEKFDQQFGGTPTTVAINAKGRLGDPDELDRQAEAVAAVADAFEDARDV